VVNGKRSLSCPELTATLETPSVTVKDLFAEAPPNIGGLGVVRAAQAGQGPSFLVTAPPQGLHRAHWGGFLPTSLPQRYVSSVCMAEIPKKRLAEVFIP
jgi:hypothetical protein